MEKINILGINLAKAGKTEILKTIGAFLIDGKKHYLVTPNPEMLLLAEKDEEFFHILNKADIAIPDGTGLKFAALAMGKNLKITAGSDLTGEIFELARKMKMKVAVMNWEKSLSRKEDIAGALKKKYPGLSFEVLAVSRTVKSAPTTNAEIIFCDQGATFQEKFIYHNLIKWPNARLAIGVGGAFDFLTGKIKRAPGFMRAAGLEWVWRLLREPKKRYKRIINAVIVFPAKFIAWRFFKDK
ncbi:MAG: WecB/TagA/CpsF family glycosyltransferase [Patescibacteria group bacterium]|jgi:N-acetylglucosaminyldiphosphoundecaprenol N-acetyl-beta-D-mannosaminyltransferase